MKKKQLYIGILSVACCALVAIGITLHLLYPKKQIQNLVKTPPVLRLKPQPADTLKKKPVKKMDFNISGTLRDKEGKGVAGVIVSDGFNCVKTDAQGRYKMKRDSLAKFIYYSVPADCEVPTHSKTDRTAFFYQKVSKGKKTYNFTLTRLPGGKEIHYKMIVIGDPQVTNAYSPYYTSPDDNPIKKSDVERFTTQTRADIRQTIQSLPAGTRSTGSAWAMMYSIMAVTTPNWSVRYARHWALQRCVSSPSSAITTRMARRSTAGNGRRISVLPIFPSTVAMCIMAGSTTASSTAACLIILLENYVSAR